MKTLQSILGFIFINAAFIASAQDDVYYNPPQNKGSNHKSDYQNQYDNSNNNNSNQNTTAPANQNNYDYKNDDSNTNFLNSVYRS